MSVYLDTSVLVALFTPDSFSPRVDAFFRSEAGLALIGDFAAAEFASAIARRVRTREFSKDDARLVFSGFDQWAGRLGPRVQTHHLDIAGTESLLRRLDHPLRAPDALHITITQRLSVPLATFDEQMLKNAIALGISVVAL